MKIKYHLLLLTAALLSLLLLQNCGPKGDGCEEHEPAHTYYKISETDKSKIPFAGTDTLVYISTDGDTAVLYGQGKKAFTEKVAENNAANPSCPRIDYNYFENIEFEYKGSNLDLINLNIALNANEESPAKSFIYTQINNVIIGASFTANNSDVLYKDSVRIGNTFFLGRRISIETPSKLSYLYNHRYGLLQITILNKIWLKRI